MNVKTVSLLILAGSLSACAGHRETARVAPIAPPVASAASPSLAAPDAPAFTPSLGVLGAPAVIAPIAPVAGLKGLSVEPLGCAFYAGDERPDYDSQTLDCIVKWMGQTRDYLAKGGKPTKYTNAQAFENYRAEARKLSARVAKWVDDSGYEPAASRIGRYEGVAAAAPPVPSGGADSEQHYLDGVILYQKGDYIGARREWSRAKELDPANADVQAGLELLDKLR